MNYEKLIKDLIKEHGEIAGSSSYISLWTKWYQGVVPSFHIYKIFNGVEYVKQRKLSAQGAKKVCEDWASLLMNEEVEIITADKEAFDAELEKMDFWTKANKAVEYGFATSLGALAVDIEAEAEEVINEETKQPELLFTGIKSIDLSVHSALRIVPITIKNELITECAFINENTNETKVSLHLLNENGNYDITVASVNSKSKVVNSVFKIPLDCPKPTFALLHPNTVNNLEVDSALPISVFANAIDTLKALDTKVDSYHNEFVLGRKRVYVSHELSKINKETGQLEFAFDPNDTTYYYLPNNPNAVDKGEPLIKIQDSTIRAIEHQTAIQDEWNALSLKCGLGIERYKFEKGRVMTATQVISEKSDVAQNVRRHEILLRHRILDLIETITWLYNQYTDKRFADTLFDIKFADGIIEDTETQKQSDRTEVASGLMSKIEYRVKWFGEDEKTARENVNKYFGDDELASRINKFLPALMQGAMTVRQFVEQVYIDEPNKDTLIAELQEKIDSQSGGITAEDIQATGFYNPSNN